MTKFFYGVQGDGAGHANRARIIAQNFPEDEFLFVGGGKAQKLKADGYQVVDIPILDTFYYDNKVNNYETAKHALKVLARRRNVIYVTITLISS